VGGGRKLEVEDVASGTEDVKCRSSLPPLRFEP